MDDNQCLFVLAPSDQQGSGFATSLLPPREVTHVKVHKTATEIPNRIFRDCTRLCQVSFEERSKEEEETKQPILFAFVIGQRAFDTCIRLEQISIPSFVTVLGELAFGDCHRLANVKLCEGVQVLEGSTFYNCSALEFFRVPSSVRVMGNGIFENCTRLVSVQLPQGLTAIEYYTFLYCKSLQDVNIPSTVKLIGKMAFQNCESLRQISLPYGLRTIREGAFAECRALFAITIPPTVDFIEYRAFENCHNMTTVQFPSGTNAKLRTASFRGLHSLINISLPKSMSPVKIVKGAFEDCTLLEEEFYEGSPLQHVPGRVDMKEHERVVEGLCQRYPSLPLHEFCYDPPASLSKDTFTAVTDSIARECGNIDCFGLTPFHILASSDNLRRDIWERLLEFMDPLAAHKCCLQRDRQGKTCIDYLLVHPVQGHGGQQLFTPSSTATTMIKILLQKSVSDRLLNWGLKEWHSTMLRLIDSIGPSSDLDISKRAHLVEKVYQLLDACERHENASLLELALWTNEMGSSNRNKVSNQQSSADRLAVRIRCGADVLIPHVMNFYCENTVVL